MQLSPDVDILAPLAGGALIGVAASLLLIGNGRVAGISGVVGDLLTTATDRGWRLAFLVAMIAVGAVAALVAPQAIGRSPAPVSLLILAGLVVGFGTRLGGGCTSGHGVCGLSRLSPRSLVATLTFMLAGMVTVAVVRALDGGP